MSSELDSALKTFRQHASLVKSPASPHIKKVQPHLVQLKLALAGVSTPAGRGTPAAAVGAWAQYAVRAGDFSDFDRAYASWKLFSPAGSSPEDTTYRALALFRLLAANRLAEFHVELEELDPEQRGSKEISYARELEKAVQEGAYERIRKAGESVPGDATFAPLFRVFTDALQETLRLEVAECLEAAYSSLPTDTVKRFLMISSASVMATMVQSRGWQVRGNLVVFRADSTQSLSESTMLTRADVATIGARAPQLIERSVAYAQELERIV